MTGTSPTLGAKDAVGPARVTIADRESATRRELVLYADTILRGEDTEYELGYRLLGQLHILSSFNDDLVVVWQDFEALIRELVCSSVTLERRPLGVIAEEIRNLARRMD